MARKYHQQQNLIQNQDQLRDHVLNLTPQGLILLKGFPVVITADGTRIEVAIA